MKYKIVEYDDAKELESLINGFLELGWEPLGGVSVVCKKYNSGEPFWWYSQVIINREKAK